MRSDWLQRRSQLASLDMEQSVQRQILRELLDHVRNGTTDCAAAPSAQDPATYVASARVEEEQASIFRRVPLVAGLSADLPEIGSFVTQDHCGIPVLIVRDRDGEVRAFLNACRHRGTRLVSEAQGRTSRFICPFHAWSYDLEGRLAGIPHASAFGEIDRSDLGLVRLPTCERNGVIWIGLQADSGALLDPALGDLAAELDGWNLSGQRLGSSRELVLAMNWKLANDTFGETYHFEFLHRRTLSLAYHGNTTAYRTFGRHHRMVFASRSIKDIASRPESEWELRSHATIAYFLFPNAQLLISPRYCSLYRIAPDLGRADRCVVQQAFYVDARIEDDDRARILQEGLALHEEVILGEDFRVAATAQAGLASGLLPRLIFGRNEPALHHYQAVFATALGRDARSRTE